MQTNKFSPHPLSMLNMTIFVLTYTFLRVLLIPYGVYILVTVTYQHTFALMPLWRQAAVIWAVIQVSLLSIFNFYWYYKMLIGMFKMFGCIKSKHGTGMGSVEEFLNSETEHKDKEDSEYNRVN